MFHPGKCPLTFYTIPTLLRGYLFVIIYRVNRDKLSHVANCRMWQYATLILIYW